MYDDTTDILYVGTNSGLFAYQQNTFIELQRLKEQRGNSFFQLKQNHQGEVFCCNLSGQIFKLDNGWTDEEPLWHLSKIYEKEKGITVNDICGRKGVKGENLMNNSELGLYIDHLIGERKTLKH